MGLGKSGYFYSAVLPNFSGNRASEACPVRKAFPGQILGGGGGGACMPERACWGVGVHLGIGLEQPVAPGGKSCRTSHT